MRRRSYFLPVMGGVLVLITLWSACVGSYPLSLSQLWAILTGELRGSMEEKVFLSLRLPRVAMGVLAGGALGLAGGIYQTIFRNSLASPDLTGVASGASFGAAAAIVLGAGTGWHIMFGSFVAGVLSLLVVLVLVSLSGMEKMGSYILSGILVSSLADAGLMLLKFMADPERELAAIEFWTMGSLGTVTAEKLMPQVLFVAVPMVVLLCCSRQAVMLSLGSEHARGLGLAPGVWRAVFLGLSTLMIAGVVSITGVIAFVGLIAPHIAFLLYRRRNTGYFVLCTLMGSVLLLVADILARSLYRGAELPLSILTVLLSVPVLAGLICRRKGGPHGALV